MIVYYKRCYIFTHIYVIQFTFKKFQYKTFYTYTVKPHLLDDQGWHILFCVPLMPVAKERRNFLSCWCIHFAIFCDFGRYSAQNPNECLLWSEIKKIQLSAKEHFQKIFNDHAKLKQQLQSQRSELEVRVHALEEREAKNETERKKLQEDIEKVSNFWAL